VVQKVSKMKTAFLLIAISFLALGQVGICAADEGVNLSVQVVARRADQTINDFDLSVLSGEKSPVRAASNRAEQSLFSYASIVQVIKRVKASAAWKR